MYLDVLAEIPGLVLESDLPDDDDAVMEPAEPTFEKQAAAALANSGVVPANIPEITGVGEKIPGVDNDVFSSVPVDDLFDDNVEGINPPNLIHPRVEVEDVDSDDKDDDEYIESVNAPSNNLGGVKRMMKERRSPTNWGAEPGFATRLITTKLTIRILGTRTLTRLTSSTPVSRERDTELRIS